MSRSALFSLARSLTLVAGVGAPFAAQAADLLPPPPPPPIPEPVAIGGGWYLRGDVGVGAAQVESIHTSLRPGYSLPDNYAIEQASVGDQFFAGAGVGYQFNSFFRGDVTGEYRGGAKIAFTEKFDNAYPDGSPAKGIDYDFGNLHSVVVMANGYVDLGTWCGFTPYLGGGIGTAFHKVSGFTDIGAGSAAGGFGTAKTKDTTSLAWAAQAGVSYNVTPNFKVDVGYRYIDMGSAKSGTVVCENSPDCAGATYKVKDITSHDVKIGVRYLLGGAVAAPLPPLAAAYEPAPGPLVRKY